MLDRKKTQKIAKNREKSKKKRKKQKRKAKHRKKMRKVRQNVRKREKTSVFGRPGKPGAPSEKKWSSERHHFAGFHERESGRAVWRNFEGELETPI